MSRNADFSSLDCGARAIVLISIGLQRNLQIQVSNHEHSLINFSVVNKVSFNTYWREDLVLGSIQSQQMLCLSPQKYRLMSEDYLNSCPTHFLLLCAIVRHLILVTALCLSSLFTLPSSRPIHSFDSLASVISQSPYFLQVLLPSSHTLLRHRTHTLECLSDAAG